MSSFALVRAALTVPLQACNRSAHRVLMVAAHLADTDDSYRSYAPLPRAWIARRLNCAPSTVARAIHDLEDAGLLVKVRPPRRASGEVHEPSVYEVQPEAVTDGPTRS